ncbi:hypothetical protein P154DRAFT_594441 [Amniculicola lignicola CBS 123094]|uniref:Uncharacterized protein n=1 Tax=Amniculicola lignicola CBS 123094 TaxID=1392246 RepID=A0A6A5VTU9_9PLEO|nr:hypothetical protein P154DRAFT_594441 [Amniculicola lignicola CBS 123094]
MESPPRSNTLLPFKKLLASHKQLFNRMDPALAAALELINLHGLEDLEEKVLKLDAFLVPWAYFRDHFLLLQPSGMPRSSLPGRISRTDILQFYNQFDEGKLRYDATADIDSDFWEEDKSKRGVIQKFAWGVDEYEKFLYVWLLQTFKVGKVKNIYGFKYFQCKNVAAAWEEVFVPIVNAVRNDYDIRGRRHYGRLALFIENVSPSRVAFPSANVRVASNPSTRASSSSVQGTMRQYIYDDNHEPHPVTNLVKPEKPQIDEDLSPELRSTVAQYGGLVERPKNKQSVQDWLAKKRQEADHKKALSLLEGPSDSFSTPHPRAYTGGGAPAYPASTKRLPALPPPSPPAAPTRENFAMGIARRASFRISRAFTDRLSKGSSSGRPLSDYPLDSPTSDVSDMSTGRKVGGDGGLHRSNTVGSQATNTADHELSSFRFPGQEKHKDGKGQSGRSGVRGVLSAREMEAHMKTMSGFDFGFADKTDEAREPAGDINIDAPPSAGPSLSASPEQGGPSRSFVSRIPVPGASLSSRAYRDRSPYPAAQDPQEEVELERVPPIPVRNPRRMHSERLPNQHDGLGPRIISRENIRAALGNPSDDEETETEAEGGDSTVPQSGSPGERLRTYNAHMFPRRG